MKSNLILAVIALLLAIPTAWTIAHDDTLFTEYSTIPRMFAGFDPERVAAIVMGKAKEGQEPPPVAPAAPNQPEQQPQVERDLLVFRRKEDGWVVDQHELAGAPVQANRVESDVLKHLEDIRVDQGTVLVRNAGEETLRKHGLAEDQAFIMKCVDGANQTLAELLVGNDARGGSYTQEAVAGFFVRKSGTRDVVLYEVPFWRQSVKVDEWLDKKVHQIESDKVAKFSFKNEKTGGQELIFEKVEGSDATWQVVQGPEGVGALRQQELENMVQRYLWIYAQDMVKPLNRAEPAKIGLQPPRLLVSATLKDGSVYSIAIGSKVPDKAEYYLSSNQRDFLYTWAEHNAIPFERDPKELFDPPPAVEEGDKPGVEDSGAKQQDDPAKPDPAKQDPAKQDPDKQDPDKQEPPEPPAGSGEAKKPGETKKPGEVKKHGDG